MENTSLLKKIKFTLFWPLSLISTAGMAFFLSDTTELFVHLGVYGASLINLYLLMYLVTSLISNQSAALKDKIYRIKLLLVFGLKMTVIFVALSLGVHFMGNKIIIPLINYVIQIFVLSVSMRHILK